MNNYRLLALDLDGTVLNDDKQISRANKRAIKQAAEAGITVMFTTGRGMQRVAHLQAEAGLEGPMVLTNGAEVWQDKEVLLARNFIRQADIIFLHDAAQAAGARFWGYSVESFTKDSEWTAAMFYRSWLKFGIRHHDPKIIARIREQIGSLHHIEITSSAPTNLEISLRGITKRYGVEKICRRFGYEMKEVMAIGDNLNDFSLIQSAGAGIAMGNADVKLKEIADAVTDTNNKAGVAKAIDKYLLR
ncbi:Cof-type HAD-IIB family hydrolase [Virgibacillus halophilus]|uniref:Cof-type HAD-IIB family hydrolase n=1 Tax=Tigheibacillus halophilus TaxID=361280 RepID=A0ABU5C476_9BACI|nr:Cof-type HAD-IIB family hydrolase [Virgibacillus halophilus]